MKIEKTEPIRIHARAIMMVIFREYSVGGESAAIVAGHKCLPDATNEQIIKIATGKARLTGCTPGPINYEEID